MNCDINWIIALAGAVVGSVITIFGEVIISKIRKRFLRKQLLKHLDIEVSMCLNNRSYSNIPTIISKHLLLTDVLDPIKDRQLLESLTTYLVLAERI